MGAGLNVARSVLMPCGGNQQQLHQCLEPLELCLCLKWQLRFRRSRGMLI